MSTNAEKLLNKVVHEVLFNGTKYPSKKDVEKNAEMIDWLIKDFVAGSFRSLYQDLVAMKYPEELAEKTTLNIVGKVFTFFGLFLLRQDIRNWIPEGFEELSLEEQKALASGMLEQVRAFIESGNAAYGADEILDDVESNQETYKKTAMGKLLEEVKVYLRNVDPDSNEMRYYFDQFKTKLINLVNTYLIDYKQYGPGVEKDSGLINHLRKAGLDGYYQMYRFVGLLGQAVIKEKGGADDPEVAATLERSVLGLADVLNYELISAWLAELIHGDNPNPDKKVVMPLVFADALGLGQEYGDSGLNIYPAYYAYFISLIESQGLVMVANAMYLRRGYESVISTDKKSVEFRVKPGFKQIPFEELFAAKNKSRRLRNYIKILQFLVRLSDDIGDYLSDKQSKSPNLLLLPRQYRHHLVGGAPQPPEEDDDTETVKDDKTKPIPLWRIQQALEEDPRATNEIKIVDESTVVSEEDVEEEVTEVKITEDENEVISQEGYLEALGEITGIDLTTPMKQLYREFSINNGALSPELVKEWIGTLVELLDLAKVKVFEEGTKNNPKDKLWCEDSYKEYVEDLDAIARGAITIGPKMNDREFTQAAIEAADGMD